MAIHLDKLRAIAPPDRMPFKIRRLGHVVLQVTALERSLVFYTQVLEFKSGWKGIRTLEAAVADPVLGQDIRIRK